MTITPNGRKGPVMLRALTDDEMSNGLDLSAWLELKRQAADMKRSRFHAMADDALARLGRRNRDMAERRLAAGLPAYVEVEGVAGIVRQLPDGTRDLMEIVDGVLKVVKRLAPVGGGDPWPDIDLPPRTA